jgi:RNA polymerase sigma-70 factor (ECF subfamily)
MYNTYADKLYNFLYARTGDPELAQDITAEAFTKAWNKRETFDGEYPQAWLFTIARNLLNDHWRAKHTYDTEIDEEAIDDQADIAERTDVKLQKENVQKIVQNLPEEMRTVVILRFFEGMSVREVADMIGKKEVHVRVIQHRALKQLKGLLS